MTVTDRNETTCRELRYKPLLVDYNSFDKPVQPFCCTDWGIHAKLKLEFLTYEVFWDCIIVLKKAFVLSSLVEGTWSDIKVCRCHGAPNIFRKAKVEKSWSLVNNSHMLAYPHWYCSNYKTIYNIWRFA